MCLCVGGWGAKIAQLKLGEKSQNYNKAFILLKKKSVIIMQLFYYKNTGININ